MTNTIETTAAVETTTYAYVTGWMKSEVATDLIAQYIKEGTYTKEQIKKSSPRFANKKDKSEGYETRVIAVAGIHPELEQMVVGYRKNIEKKVRPSATPLKPWKSMLNVENIAIDEEGNLKISDKCIWFKDGSRLQLFTKKG